MTFHRKRIFIFTFLVFLSLVWFGCAALPALQRTAVYEFGRIGEVRMLDRPAVLRLRLIDQSVRRDSEDRLVVRTQWRNNTGSPFRARLRRTFLLEDGSNETEDPAWDVQVIAPEGITVIEWKSQTPAAVAYLIEVGTEGR